MTADLHATVAPRLRRHGHRFTEGRRVLIDLLSAADRPLTLPEILEAGGGLAQSSVYRNLSVLEQSGVVHRVVTAGEYAHFELVEDLTEHHHHLVCVHCGAVADVVVPPRVERAVERALDELATSAGFQLEGHRLDLVGKCADCA